MIGGAKMLQNAFNRCPFRNGIGISSWVLFYREGAKMDLCFLWEELTFVNFCVCPILQAKARQARKQSRKASKMLLIKCVVNNTHGKEAGKQGRQESKAGEKCGK